MRKRVPLKREDSTPQPGKVFNSMSAPDTSREPTRSTATYRRAAVKGMGWLTALQIGSALVSQASTIFLALLLSPTDFGVYGTAMIAIALIAIPGDLGLTVELVRGRNFDRAFPTAFKLRWGVAAALSLTAILSSPLFGALLAMPRIVLIIATLSLIFPGAALGFGPRAILTRNLDFRTIAIADLVGKLASPLTAVLLAFLGYGYWSLAMGLLVSQWATSIAAIILKPVKASGSYDRIIAKQLIAFGKFVSLSTVAGYLLSTADNIIAVSVFGVAALGFYALAYSFAVTVPRNVASMVETVTFPIFSKLSDDIHRLQQGFLTTLRFVAYVTFPVAAGLVVFSPAFVDEFLGNRWHETGVLMSVLGLAGLMYGLAVPSSALLYSLGKPGSVTIANSIGAAVLIGVLGFAIVFSSLDFIAVAAVCGAVSYFLSLGVQASRALHLRGREIVRALYQPSFASAIAGICSGISLVLMVPFAWSLEISIGVGAATYILAIEVVSKGEFSRSARQITLLVVR